MANNNLQIQHQDERIDGWFNDFVDRLRADHFILKSGNASKETKHLYDTLMDNNQDQMNRDVRRYSTVYFLKSLMFEYLTEIDPFKGRLRKLALGLSDSKILVWSEIENDDEAVEDALLLAEAKVNAKFFNDGFYLNSTIVEHSDNLPTPAHYQNVLD